MSSSPVLGEFQYNQVRDRDVFDEDETRHGRTNSNSEGGAIVGSFSDESGFKRPSIGSGTGVEVHQRRFGSIILI